MKEKEEVVSVLRRVSHHEDVLESEDVAPSILRQRCVI
jgi:hypothetical protein